VEHRTDPHNLRPADETQALAYAGEIAAAVEAGDRVRADAFAWLLATDRRPRRTGGLREYSAIVPVRWGWYASLVSKLTDFGFYRDDPRALPLVLAREMAGVGGGCTIEYEYRSNREAVEAVVAAWRRLPPAARRRLAEEADGAVQKGVTAAPPFAEEPAVTSAGSDRMPAPVRLHLLGLAAAAPPGEADCYLWLAAAGLYPSPLYGVSGQFIEEAGGPPRVVHCWGVCGVKGDDRDDWDLAWLPDTPSGLPRAVYHLLPGPERTWIKTYESAEDAYAAVGTAWLLLKARHRAGLLRRAGL
jgi:hypothetical protein